jgi:hypothetical protein
MRDFDDQQSQLFFVLASFLHNYDPPDFHPNADQDVAEAAAALANTLETAARSGVIYEHQPASLPAGRLATALRAVLAEAGAPGGPAFDRTAALVLRRLEEGARPAGDTSDRRRFLALLGRVLQNGTSGSGPLDPQPRSDEPRVILP